MSAAACAVYYHEKQKQTEKVFDDRYAAILATSDISFMHWAEDNLQELYRKYQEEGREVDRLWSDGQCTEAFKNHVLTYFRTALEICKRYAAELEKRQAA